ADHFSGRPLASETPCALGPRHCGQFLEVPGAESAAIAEIANQANTSVSNKIRITRLSPCGKRWKFLSVFSRFTHHVSFLHPPILQSDDALAIGRIRFRVSDLHD